MKFPFTRQREAVPPLLFLSLFFLWRQLRRPVLLLEEVRLFKKHVLLSENDLAPSHVLKNSPVFPYRQKTILTYKKRGP